MGPPLFLCYPRDLPTAVSGNGKIVKSEADNIDLPITVIAKDDLNKLKLHPL